MEDVKIIGRNGCSIWFLLGKAQTVLSSDNWPQMDSSFVKENIVVGGKNNTCWIRDSLDKVLSFQWKGDFGSNPSPKLQRG